MAAILRSPATWSTALVLLLLATWLIERPIVRALAPLLAACGLVYVIARLVQVRRAARGPAAAPPDRTLRALPRIIGEIQETDAAATIDPAAMQAYLSARVLGQELVAEQLARGIYRRMAQERRSKPLFTALLSGPTGTGKTEMAKAVADFLYGPRSLFRVDCANVIGEAGLQTLIGSPKGYAGSESWGRLTAHLRTMPSSVLLFDEIEKAVTSPNAPMAKLLLSLLDEGVCTEQSDGTRVSATGCVILLTSNAAQDRLGTIFQHFRDQPEGLIRATKDALRDYFAPEFLGRIDLVTTFAPLSDEARASIVALHVGRVGSSYGLEVSEIDAAFVNHALGLWTTLHNYGTREIIRWIEEALAEELIRCKSAGVAKVRLGWKDGCAQVEAV